MKPQRKPKLPINGGSGSDSDLLFENQIAEMSKREDTELETWITAQEAADYLKISVESLRNMTSNGQVPHYKLGRRVRYLKSELRTLLKANKRGAYYGN